MTQKEIEKVNSLLKLKYNIFHADLITRAMQDESISVEEFEGGCITIGAAEFINEDEFVPSGWGEV
jgi:hypothetical protein|nr:MAG TPA: hypothetical protein [Caudoviricetes sp.]DAN47675.1 MAG TPA: hypothetical protein [Caudoviricetes sp.]